jgi:CRISPR-associated protein Csh1
MIQAIKEIGDTILKRAKKNPLSTLIQNPKAENVIAIVFEKRGDNFKFLEVKPEEFDSGKVDRYLYRKGSANGANITPTSRITEIEKTFNLKIKGWFESMDLSGFKMSNDDKSFLSNLKAAFVSAKEDIANKLAAYENPRNSMLTLKVKDGDDEKYIGDFTAFQDYLLQSVAKKDLKVTSKDKLCSLCGKTRDSVIGKLDTFKFYTLDKPGFISSGFKEEDAWKNYPVCRECKLSLEEGRKFLMDTRGGFSFYGLRYYIIPKFIMGSGEVKERVLRLIEDITREEQTLSDRDRREIERREERILRILGQEGDYLTFNFLFLRSEQASERILLLIEDVLPSRIRTILKKKDEVDEILGEKLRFNFGRVRRFFQKSDEGKRNNDLDRYFLEIIDRTFKGGKLDFHFILQIIMRKIRKDFLDSETEDTFFFDVRDAISDILFFEKLGLINFEEATMATEKFSSFFEKYGKSFSRPEARGIFLLGSLTELLLRKQYTEREAKPFLKQLQGLKLSEKEIKGLLPKVQNKLEEYKSFDTGKREIAEAASYYLLEAGNNWKLSNDEINFFFACGMNLANEISNTVYKDKGGKEDGQQ